MKFFKATFLVMILALFTTACAYDGVYASDHYVHGTIYDNRYRAHYDNQVNGYRHHGRGYRHRSHIRLDIFTRESGLRIHHHRTHGRFQDYRHCRFVLREDYDPVINRRVVRRYRVCS